MNDWNARTAGYVYIAHFDRPIGNMANARAQASHYVGFAVDVEERIETQLSGRGAKIIAAALKRGVSISFHVFPACLAVEKLIKRNKQTSDFCPDCARAAGRQPRPIPAAPLFEQTTLELDAADSGAGELPDVAPLRMDWLELKIMRDWRAARVAPVLDLSRVDELL